MPRYTTENFVTECLLKVQTFLLIYMRKKFSWKVVLGWMDEITKKKRENTINLKSAVYQHKKNLVRNLYAADIRYHLGCWLGVTVKYRPAGPVHLLQQLY